MELSNMYINSLFFGVTLCIFDINGIVITDHGCNCPYHCFGIPSGEETCPYACDCPETYERPLIPYPYGFAPQSLPMIETPVAVPVVQPIHQIHTKPGHGSSAITNTNIMVHTAQQKHEAPRKSRCVIRHCHEPCAPRFVSRESCKYKCYCPSGLRRSSKKNTIFYGIPEDNFRHTHRHHRHHLEYAEASVGNSKQKTRSPKVKKTDMEGSNSKCPEIPPCPTGCRRASSKGCATDCSCPKNTVYSSKGLSYDP